MLLPMYMFSLRNIIYLHFKKKLSSLQPVFVLFGDIHWQVLDLLLLHCAQALQHFPRVVLYPRNLCISTNSRLFFTVSVKCIMGSLSVIIKIELPHKPIPEILQIFQYYVPFCLSETSFHVFVRFFSSFSKS